MRANFYFVSGLPVPGQNHPRSGATFCATIIPEANQFLDHRDLPVPGQVLPSSLDGPKLPVPWAQKPDLTLSDPLMQAIFKLTSFFYLELILKE